MQILLIQKKNSKFKDAFIKATRSKGKSIKIPKFELEDIEDYYTYFVLILGISESTFWEADISFMLSVLENKTAYDNYISYIKEKEYEKAQRRR